MLNKINYKLFILNLLKILLSFAHILNDSTPKENTIELIANYFKTTFIHGTYFLHIILEEYDKTILLKLDDNIGECNDFWTSDQKFCTKRYYQ